MLYVINRATEEIINMIINDKTIAWFFTSTTAILLEVNIFIKNS